MRIHNVEARYTTSAYETANPDWHDGDAEWKAGHILALLRDYTIEPESMCDVGCGSGGVLSHLAKQLDTSCRIVGYDIAPRAISLAREMHRESRLTFERIDSIDEIHDHFEVVLLLDVFEHVQDYIGFLGAVRRLGKRFIFHIPLDLSIQSLWDQELIMARRRSVGHLHHFCRTTALDSLAISGYKVSAVSYTDSSMTGKPYSWRNSIRRWATRAAFRVWPDRTVDLFGGYSLLVLAEKE